MPAWVMRTWRPGRLLWSSLVAVPALVLVVLLVNAWRQPSRQLPPAGVSAPRVDAQAAALRLAQAVRARTVSGLQDPAAAERAFDELYAHLQRSYPRVHQALQREQLAGRTLVYTWRGRDERLRPLALLAHQDVVPIAPGTEGAWSRPPFGGDVAEGQVWGRGAWDNKANLIAQLEAVEQLLASGFQPMRTVVFVFGHDEELGGNDGAARVAQAMRERGQRFEAVLDEGLLVTQGMLPGVDAPVALVGVAEKGFVSLRLLVETLPGHSSMPPATGQGAVARLAKALVRLDAQPLPGRMHVVVGDMLETLAPEMPWSRRIALANLWLFGPLVERMLAAQPGTNALLRTTTALTVLRAGVVDNQLPGRAEALVNLRILPGDSVEGVRQQVERIVGDDGVKVSVHGLAIEPSRVSSTQAPAYRWLAQAVRASAPGSVVAPGLMLGGTDARHFEAIADNVYRFSPIRARSQDLDRFHGTNERIAIDNLVEMIHFYHRLLLLAAGDPTGGPPP